MKHGTDLKITFYSMRTLILAKYFYERKLRVNYLPIGTAVVPVQ